MRKEKTVIVSACDFCIREDCAVWKCVHCDKESCAQCGRNWTIRSEEPRSWSDSIGVAASMGYLVPEFSAFVCNECAKNEMSTPLLRFGFQEGEARTVGSAIRTGTTG